MDANGTAVIHVFENDLPALQAALATLEACVHHSCAGNIAAMPKFPCGKPRSSTFPHHGSDGNTTADANHTTEGNTRCRWPLIHALA